MPSCSCRRSCDHAASCIHSLHVSSYFPSAFPHQIDSPTPPSCVCTCMCARESALGLQQRHPRQTIWASNLSPQNRLQLQKLARSQPGFIIQPDTTIGAVRHVQNLHFTSERLLLETSRRRRRESMRPSSHPEGVFMTQELAMSSLKY